MKTPKRSLYQGIQLLLFDLSSFENGGGHDGPHPIREKRMSQVDGLHCELFSDRHRISSDLSGKGYMGLGSEHCQGRLFTWTR